MPKIVMESLNTALTIPLLKIFEARGCGFRLDRLGLELDLLFQGIIIDLVRGNTVERKYVLDELTRIEEYDPRYLDLFDLYEHLSVELSDREVINNFPKSTVCLGDTVIVLPLGRLLRGFDKSRDHLETIFVCRSKESAQLFGKMVYTLTGGSADIIVRWFSRKPPTVLRRQKTGNYTIASRDRLHRFLVERELTELQIDHEPYQKHMGYLDDREDHLFQDNILVTSGLPDLLDSIEPLLLGNRSYSVYCDHCFTNYNCF